MIAEGEVQISFKRSAVHNARVTHASVLAEGIAEGLVLPRPLMELADIEPFEQVVVTNLRGTNWSNRLATFAIPGEEGRVEARGSLAAFLRPGDLICLITWGALAPAGVGAYESSELVMVDVGFAPASDHGNRTRDAELAVERIDRREVVPRVPVADREQRGRHSTRTHLSHLVSGLEVTETHPDCLQGSAEIPEDVMVRARLGRYRHVHVYNASAGGVAETYVVPTPPGVVMTTGAMAKFAPTGSRAHVAVYETGRPKSPPRILHVHDNSAESAVQVEI